MKNLNVPFLAKFFYMLGLPMALFSFLLGFLYIQAPMQRVVLAFMGFPGYNVLSQHQQQTYLTAMFWIQICYILIAAYILYRFVILVTQYAMVEYAKSISLQKVEQVIRRDITKPQSSSTPEFAVG